ncbi:MAG: hypothetical protein HQM16_02255 [Deltaproteobacteria bacterium]|nr:hypothetical protein [Deltaproteobacteria bacterium]
MNLEKIGLILFIKYIQQIESVKSHLGGALKELLLAMASTLDITTQITQDTFIIKNISAFKKTFKKIELLLTYSINQLETTPAVPYSATKLKKNIVDSLVTVLDEEIEKIAQSSEQNKDLKIEALHTVKGVLYQHTRKSQRGNNLENIFELENAINL